MFTSTPDRLPPQAVDKEEAILGGILFDPNAIERVKDILPPEAFYLTSHRDIYRAALQLHEDGKPIDLMTIIGCLRDKRWLERCGGQAKIMQLVDRIISAVNIDRWAEDVNEKYRRRQVIELGTEIQLFGYDSTTDEAVVVEEIKIRLEKIASLSTGILSAKDKLIAEVKKIQQLESPVDQHFAWDKLSKETGKSKRNLMELSLAIEADEPLKIWSAKQFAQRQLVATDWLVPGLLRMGTTSLLVAESKTGKSLLHYDWAYSVATGTGWGEFPATDPKKVLIVQTDEPEVDCQNRIIYRGLDSLENVSVMTSFSTHQIARIRKEIANKNLDLVIIDSLTSINKFSGISANDIEFAYFMYRLKDLASEFGCHILCVHHTNKAPGQAGLEKVAGSYGIPASVSDIFLLERRPGAEQDDLERILKRLGSRSDGRSAWKIRLNLEDNSFEYLGHCDKNGDTDERAEKETQNKLENKELILAFLQANAPVAYEALEVAEELKINRDTVRRLLGDLSKGDAPLIASKRSSREGARCNAYFYPTDQHLADQLGDQLPDQLSNPSAVRNTASTDQVISKKGGKTFSPDHVTVAAETNINCDSSAPKSENFPTDQVADQLIKNPSNSFPVSDTATDQATDQLNGADQLEQTPPYPSIGDWIWSHPTKKQSGMVGYISKLVGIEARGVVAPQGRLGEVNISRWAWEKGECEPYDHKKHPPIPQALLDYVRLVIEKQTATIEVIPQEPTEIVESSGLPEPKFKEGDRVSWTEKAEFGTIQRYEQSPEKCLVHLDKHGDALIEESKLELVKTNPRFVVGDRCRYKDQVGTVIFPHLNSPYVVWDEPDRSGVAIRSLAGLETTTEEGGELLPAPKAVANYLSLNAGDTVRIGKHPQHKPKWYQKGGQKVRVLSINLGLSANQLFAIAEIPGEEFPVKLFLSAVDIVEETNGDRREG